MYDIYIYMCMYTHRKRLCRCMYVCMYVCMYACMHACMHACMQVCMHVCVYVYIYIHIISSDTLYNMHYKYQNYVLDFREFVLHI